MSFLIALAGDTPAILVGQQHAYPCGCEFLIGIRLDTREPAMLMHGCDEHRGAMQRTQQRYAVACEAPYPTPYEGRPVMECVKEIYEEEASARPRRRPTF